MKAFSPVRHLGPDCKNYSLNNEGPCINGGKLTCNGDEVAPEIICECPPHYKGMFCEDKMENVIEMFSMFSFPSPTCGDLLGKYRCKHDDILF